MPENIELSSRKSVFLMAIGLIFAAFLFRLVQLQILYEDVYGEKSKENSIRQIARDPIRGLIYDRNGILIVDNRPSYTVVLMPAEFDTGNVNYLAEILRLEPSAIKEKYVKGMAYNRFTPVKIKRDIDFPTLSVIEENRDRLRGIDYQVESKRYYPTKAKATHLFGYTKEISDQELMEMGNEYKPGDNIGASGLEAAYERYLRGHKGYELITVNAKGQMLGAFNEGKTDIAVKEGNILSLAIDSDLQAFAESSLTNRRGAVVAIDPSDGGILALVSKPDYDLTMFGSVIPRDVWVSLNSDSSTPLFNRATLTRYPPGSTFKMVLAAAAIQEGVISTNWRIQCPGAFRFGTKVFKDHIPHGSTNVVEAIQRSCNVFFYQLMLKTGLEKWNRFGREFGFGSPTGIDILEETAGLLPSEEYFDRVYGKGRWTQGYLVSLGIGQGEVGVSPLQMACYASTIGNKGNYYTPHVVQKIRDKETGQILDIQPGSRQVMFSEETWDVLRQGMYKCVNEPGGTGAAARVRGIVVAGKTGTAENPPHKDHAWFIGFAPMDHPKIAICVLVENAGFGGAIAAPIAGMCIEKYIYRQLIRGIPNREVASVKSIPEEADTSKNE